MASKFEIGQVVATVNLVERVKNLIPPQTDLLVSLLRRHMSGDWGDVCEDDQGLNEKALADGGRLMSVYQVQPGFTVWVITEADRSTTTLLLPEDY